MFSLDLSSSLATSPMPAPNDISASLEYLLGALDDLPRTQDALLSKPRRV